MVQYPGVLTPRNGGPVLYPEEHWPAENDRITWGFVVAAIILVLAALVPYISFYNGKKLRAAMNTTVFASIYVGLVIMICNFGKEWHTGSVVSREQYVAFSDVHIRAEIGLHIGFRGINVTLVGTPRIQNNQSIYYNEEFSWEFQQGIGGRGPYAGRITQEYFNRGIMQGLPLPVLHVAEWFILEGEYIHWSRYYRIGGLYSHIVSWISFVSWGLTNILFFLSLPYAALGTIITGFIMVLVNIVWAGMANMAQDPLVLPFRDGVIRLSYGWCFYLNLFTGLACIVLGVVFMLLLSWSRTRTFFVDAADNSGAGRAVSEFFQLSKSQYFEKAEIIEMAEVEAKRDSDDKKEEDSDDDDSDEAEPEMKEAQDKMVTEGMSKRKMAKKKVHREGGITFKEPDNM